MSETCAGVERSACILTGYTTPVPGDHRCQHSQPALTQRPKSPSYYLDWSGVARPPRRLLTE